MPVIGITSTNRLESDDNYITAIERFGGEPRIFAALDSSIRTHLASISEYLSHIDGLLLTGGCDINPSVYFQEPHDNIGDVSRPRDALEIRLFQKALEADMPVFGICRGIQIMSVAMGGSLHQHIPDIPNLPQALPHKIAGDDSRHEIEITEGSLLRDLIGEPFAEVNSAHHQAVDVVGEGFVVTARSPADGIIELRRLSIPTSGLCSACNTIRSGCTTSRGCANTRRNSLRRSLQLHPNYSEGVS